MIALLVEFAGHDDGRISCTIDRRDPTEPYAEGFKPLQFPALRTVEPVVVMPVDRHLHAQALRQRVEDAEAIAVVPGRFVRDEHIGAQVGQPIQVVRIDA